MSLAALVAPSAAVERCRAGIPKWSLFLKMKRTKMAFRPSGETGIQCAVHLLIDRIQSTAFQPLNGRWSLFELSAVSIADSAIVLLQ